LRPRRSSVANSSTVGKLEKSSGLVTFSATISTARLIMMLKMKPMSSTIAGTGSTRNTTSNKVASGRIEPRDMARILASLPEAGFI